MTATTIGMSRSLVEVLAGCPSPDGDGAAEAAAGGDGVAAAGAAVTVEPFAGVIVSSSAWPRTAAGAARATMTAAAASRLTDRPRPGRGARVMAASVRATPL